MSVASAPYFWLVCDGCGVSSTEDSEFTAWAEVDGAVAHAQDGYWHIDGSSHRCFDCGPAETETPE